MRCGRSSNFVGHLLIYLPVYIVCRVDHHMVDISRILGESFPRHQVVVCAEVQSEVECHAVVDVAFTSCREHVVNQTRSVPRIQRLRTRQNIHT